MNFSLARDPFGDLILTDQAGQKHVGITPVRLFPHTDREQWISLVDGRSKELVLIENLTELAAEFRQLIEEELAKCEFVPEIKRIVRVSGDTEPCEWEVETDRGPTKFVLKSEDDVRRIGPQRALIIDAHGLRYLVPNARALDPRSRRVIEQYI